MRGLKLLVVVALHLNRLSHPTWVRGLKQLYCRESGKLIESHPTWVRGLKPHNRFFQILSVQSHPTWVRGLKLSEKGGIYLDLVVAPYVGAWIETFAV